MCLGRWGRWEWGPEQEKAEGRGRSWKGCDGRGAAGWRAEPKVGRVPPLRSPPPPPPHPAAEFVVLEPLRPAGALLWDCSTSGSWSRPGVPIPSEAICTPNHRLTALSRPIAGTTRFGPTSALPRPFPGAAWRGLEKLGAEFPRQACPPECRVSGCVGRRPRTRLLPQLGGSEEKRRDKGERGGSLELGG